jgi:hypothetical protein
LYVNLEHKAAFLAHPRTGSRSVADLLKRHGFKQVRKGKHPDVLSVDAVPFRMWPNGGHHARAFERPDDWKFAATVRHHYDVIIAWMYAKGLLVRKRAEDVTMEEFQALIKQIHLDGNALHYPKEDSLLTHMEHASFVIQYTYLQKDVMTFLGETVGLHDGGDYEFKHLGVSPRNGVTATDILSPQMRGYIHERYGSEMEDWGFLVDGKAVGYT